MNLEQYRQEATFLKTASHGDNLVADYGSDWFWLKCVVKDARWLQMKARLVEFLLLIDSAACQGTIDAIVMPPWLTKRLGREPTQKEADEFDKLFFETPFQKRFQLIRPWGLWSPSGFIYWFTPEMRQFLIRQFVGGPDCEIRIAVAGLPVALDAFEFLVAAAAEVPVENVLVEAP